MNRFFHRRKPAPAIDATPRIHNFMRSRILGLLRHALTFGGGYMISQGWLDADQVASLAGAAIAIIGALWSVKEKGDK